MVRVYHKKDNNNLNYADILRAILQINNSLK
jgi:hypothetical protein